MSIQQIEHDNVRKGSEIVPERNDKIDNWQGNDSVEGVISG